VDDKFTENSAHKTSDNLQGLLKMTIKVHHTLLLTGAAGGLGTALRERLKANCDVLRLSGRGNLGTPREGEEIVVADLADAEALGQAVKGCDAIVHMGGMSQEGAFGPILQGNILGVYNLYEAARQHGVKRVIFASSNHVTGFYRQDQVITPAHPARPTGLYGLWRRPVSHVLRPLRH
jgi:uronate dehydrogenase